MADAAHRFHIPHEHLRAVIDGVEMDVPPRRYETFDELAEYCRRVASAVGLACIHVWGFDSPAAIEPAIQCGLAVQLTNILRDLKEDADAGRVYLPLADLRQCGSSVEELQSGAASPALRQLIALEIARARRLYHEGCDLIDHLDPSGRRIFGMMMSVYYRLLCKIERAGTEVFSSANRVERFGEAPHRGPVAPAAAATDRIAIEGASRMLPRHRGWSVSTLLTIGLLAGCNGSPEPQAPRPATPKAKPAASKKPAPAPSNARPKSPAETPAHPEPPPARNAVAPPADSGPRGLADLLETPPDAVARMIPDLPRTKVDDARAAALGIRKLTGKHVDLYTDFPPGPEIDALPEVFDQAFPQWCEYFHVDPARHADWRLIGLRDSRPRPVQAGRPAARRPAAVSARLRPELRLLGLRPAERLLSPAPGAARGDALFHEHAAGGVRAAVVHGGDRRASEHPSLARRPARNGLRAGRQGRGADVGADQDRQGRLCGRPGEAAGRRAGLRRSRPRRDGALRLVLGGGLLLDRHPRYQARFRRLWEDVLRPDFNQRFLQALGDDGPRLAEEWQVFVGSLEYGMDVARGVLDFTPGKPLPADGATVEVAADRGWQNSGVRLERGAVVPLAAEGRYQVADKPQIWWCEPGGVTIRYYQGRPLGILLAAVRPDSPAGRALPERPTAAPTLVQVPCCGRASSGSKPSSSPTSPARST